jgi:hypothetical protein
MSHYHLAQLNIAVIKAPLDSPVMADFVANLDRINALAEASPGFIWRLKGDDNNATALRPLGADTIVNMSVWQDIAALQHYVYQSAHVTIMRRRREWFERMATAYMVLWWVPQGHRPTVAEALSRLDALKQHGPTALAFTFRAAYSPPDAAELNISFGLGSACPAG